MFSDLTGRCLALIFIATSFDEATRILPFLFCPDKFKICLNLNFVHNIYKEKLDKLTSMKVWQDLCYSVMSSSYIPLNILSLPFFPTSFIHSFIAHTHSILISSYIYVHASAFLFTMFRLVFRTRIKCLIVYSIRIQWFFKFQTEINQWSQLISILHYILEFICHIYLKSLMLYT